MDSLIRGIVGEGSGAPPITFQPQTGQGLEPDWA